MTTVATSSALNTPSPDDAKCIPEPREVDVLCGRGGMVSRIPALEYFEVILRFS
jgi:hypothetical protein